MYTNAIMTQREADLIAERDAAMEIARQLQMEQDLHAIALTKERDQLRQAAQEEARCLWFTLGTLEDSNETDRKSVV